MEHVCSPLRFNYEIRSIKLVYSDYKWISKLTKIIRFLKCKHKVKSWQCVRINLWFFLVQNQTSGRVSVSAPSTTWPRSASPLHGSSLCRSLEPAWHAFIFFLFCVKTALPSQPQPFQLQLWEPLTARGLPCTHPCFPLSADAKLQKGASASHRRTAEGSETRSGC